MAREKSRASHLGKASTSEVLDSRALHKSLDRALLCATSVSSVSLWLMKFRVKPHHRDTEDTEVAQRNPEQGTFVQVCLETKTQLRFNTTGRAAGCVRDAKERRTEVAYVRPLIGAVEEICHLHSSHEEETFFRW